MWKNTANKPACTYQHILHFIEGERITVSAVQTAIPKREWHFSFFSGTPGHWRKLPLAAPLPWFQAKACIKRFRHFAP